MTDQATSPTEQADSSGSNACSTSLVNRLRGIYTVPVDDGAGLLNGSDTFTRKFDGLPPINEEAAKRIEQLESDLELAKEKIARLEEIAGWALTVEIRNTSSWMRGLQGVINKELVASGDARRCTFDGNELRLRNVTQCIPDED